MRTGLHVVGSLIGKQAVVQGEVDELLERLPKEHREAVAHVISMASQGSLCASASPRSTPRSTPLSPSVMNRSAVGACASL